MKGGEARIQVTQANEAFVTGQNVTVPHQE